MTGGSVTAINVEKISRAVSNACAVLVVTGYTANAEPTSEEFVLYVESSISFVEQCIAQDLIDQTNIHNENHRILESSGVLDSADWWGAIQAGAGGDIYDIIKGRWVTVPFSRKTCAYVFSEQEKVYISLSRHD